VTRGGGSSSYLPRTNARPLRRDLFPPFPFLERSMTLRRALPFPSQESTSSPVGGDGVLRPTTQPTFYKLTPFVDIRFLFRPWFSSHRDSVIQRLPHAPPAPITGDDLPTGAYQFCTFVFPSPMGQKSPKHLPSPNWGPCLSIFPSANCIILAQVVSAVPFPFL